MSMHKISLELIRSDTTRATYVYEVKVLLPDAFIVAANSSRRALANAKNGLRRI